MNKETTKPFEKLSEKQFNEDNSDVLRTLDLHYFKTILDENNKLKQTKFLFTFSPIGLDDPYIRNICHKVISAPSKREALIKFILNDDGQLLDLFFRFSYNYGDSKTEQFPKGETFHYYKQLTKLKLLPKYENDWDEQHCIMKDECVDEEEFLKPYQQFLNSNVENLIDYISRWSDDGREFRIYEINEDEYLW